MFNKLVAIEPVSLIPSAERALHLFAKEVVLSRCAEMMRIVARMAMRMRFCWSYTSRLEKGRWKILT